MSVGSYVASHDATKGAYSSISSGVSNLRSAVAGQMQRRDGMPIPGKEQVLLFPGWATRRFRNLSDHTVESAYEPVLGGWIWIGY